MVMIEVQLNPSPECQVRSELLGELLLNHPEF
jgi:hypothetical protein